MGMTESEQTEVQHSPARLQRLKEAREARLRDRYPYPCPTCGATPGERCLTVTGKRTAQHWPRTPQVRHD